MTSWNESMEIGVRLIDEQHHELVDKLDEFVDFCKHGDGHAEVGQTLKYVVSYIKNHFKDEEELQALYAYPDMVEHKRLHEGFISRTVDFIQELKKNGPSEELSEKVKKSLLLWFIRHIHIEDVKVGNHIKDAGHE